MNNQAKLNFYASAPEACGYLADRKSISAFADPHADMDMAIYNELIQHGFRRSGDYIYRPHCPECSACIPVRIPVQAKRFSRNEQRVIRRNSDLCTIIKPNRYCDEHFDLYRRYINSRHAEGSMANPSKSDYRRFLMCDWADTIFFEYRLNRILIQVAVCDVTETGLSAVYTFFDPDQVKRSLGHYAILEQIREAQARHLDYLYLGYWINDCSKMNYKRRYKPLEAYLENQWVLLD